MLTYVAHSTIKVYILAILQLQITKVIMYSRLEGMAKLRSLGTQRNLFVSVRVVKVCAVPSNTTNPQMDQRNLESRRAK